MMDIMKRPAGKIETFIDRSEAPYNGGPPLPVLVSSFVTPIPAFFVRSHGAVPRVDGAEWRLAVTGAVARPVELTLDDLKSFPRVEVVAALECAGNRREELLEVRPIPGELPWGLEAVGNAVWSGVRLKDVLAKVRPGPEGRHVEFTGIDRTERHSREFAYASSIPLDKAMAPEVIIALSMNGAPLPPEHGFPARTIVPGFIGARSVKWLTAIRVQEHESENYFQKKAYKVFPPDVRPENVNWDQAPALLEFPVNAVIGSVEPAGSASLLVRGYALSGVGPIVKVEVSSDGGSNWKDAVIEPGEGAWSWRLWEARVPAGRSGLDIVARATDSTGATQPANVAPLWNFKGYMNNAWHRVRA